MLYSIGLIYMMTFYNVNLFRWITNNIIQFEYQNLLVSLLYFPLVLFVIYRIWSFKNIEKNTKGNWTVLLIFLSIVTIPIYIWKKDDDFVKRNNSLKFK